MLELYSTQGDLVVVSTHAFTVYMYVLYCSYKSLIARPFSHRSYGMQFTSGVHSFYVYILYIILYEDNALL